MRRQWSLRLLLAAPVLALVSLYLPWRQASCGYSDADFFNEPQGANPGLFVSCTGVDVDGWSSIGEVAALSALLLVVLAGAALLRPRLADRLPLAQCALALAYLTAAVVAQARHDAGQLADVEGNFHYGSGTYIGVVAGALALVAAVALRRDEISLVPAQRTWAPLLAAAGLLAALLLPWARWGFGSSEFEAVHLTQLGIFGGGTIAALLSLRFVVVRWRDGVEAWPERFALSAAALLFVGARFAVDFPVTRAYGAWIGIGLAAAVLVLTIAVERPRALLAFRPSWRVTIAGAGLAALAVSLFLPWQQQCYPRQGEFVEAGVGGRCVSANGWALESSVAVLLALTLVVVALAPRLLRLSQPELAAGLALLVATAGFRLELVTHAGVRFELGFGAIIGFAAAALLVGLAFAQARPPAVDSSRARVAVPAIALGVAYLVAVVVPWWSVLPDDVWSVFSIRVTRLSWLTVAAALLAVRLTWLWAARLSRRSAAGGADELVVLPVVLTVLATLDAVRYGVDDLPWNTGLLAGLAVALTLAGLIERAGGVQRVRVPDFLRIDRI